MKSVKSGKDEKNGSVNVVTSRELDSVLVLVELAEEKESTKGDGKKEVPLKPFKITFNDVGVGDGNSETRA